MSQGRGKDRIVITTNQVISQGRGKDRIVITTNQVMSQGQSQSGPFLVPDSSPGLL
jgi:hypothetical protein